MAGRDFVKMIGPVGAVVFIVAAFLAAWVCLTAGSNPIPGYTPPESAEYYAENSGALKAELEQNVFPRLEGDFICEIEGPKLVITITGGNFAVARSAILQYYDQRLFEFVNGNTPAQ